MQAVRDYLYLTKNRKKLSRPKIEALQLKSLQKIVEYAKAHSPFYHELYGDKIIQSFEDFYQLPTINKQIMMDHFSTLNTCGLNKEAVMAYAVEKELNKDYLGYYQDEYVVGLSSGTSGNKGLYITPKSMTKRLPGVFLSRGGITLKDLPLRILFCLRVFSQGFDDINAPLLKLKYISTMTDVAEVIKSINQSKINLLMAPPSFIRQLLPKHAEITVKLKKIITYAEVLSSTDKAVFEQAFHTQVVEIYQASEGQIASACSHGHIHINEDLVFIELYDEAGVLINKPHVVGHKMVLTNLINFAQPLIRYEMNDMIVLDEPCPCGSHFRRIEKILGRSDDNIYFYDINQQPKIVFSDLFSRWIITTSDAIREFQVIQEDISTLDITLDLMGAFDVNHLKERIDHELRALGLHGSYTFHIGPLELPKHANKFKRFISHLKKE
jgi:putative adenylate-forming enzyme